jgi:hypothetical protein
MKLLDTHTKFAHLGKPGTYFTSGFQRRLDLIRKRVDAEKVYGHLNSQKRPILSMYSDQISILNK